jgi:small conductance mechanosensitive channel
MQDLVAFYREIDPETRIVLVQTLRIIAILVLAWFLQIVAARLIRIFRTYMARRTGGDEVARIETLARVFRNAAVIVIFLVAGTLVLGELGISIAPILATAGVAGVAIGFGAQSLIKDFLGGFFLLLDDQLRQGDVVEIAGLSGLVEEVTLRYVRLRNFEGHVHFVPNGEIKTVTNRTRGFAHAVIEAGVAYREDPDEALAVMKDVARAMRADALWQARLPDDLEVIGVERLADSAVILRSRLKVVPPIEQWNVRREFLKRLKKAFDERGIEIPFPHLTVYAGADKEGRATPFHLKGALEAHATQSP